MVAVALGIAVPLMPDVAVETLIFLLYFALLVIGIGRILVGALFKLLPQGLRVVSIIAGVIMFGLAITILAYQYPYFGTAVLISLLGFALLIHGVARITIDGLAKILPNWIRGLLIVGGLLSVTLSITALIFPAAAVLTLVFLLSIALLWNGIDAIVSGVTGAS